MYEWKIDIILNSGKELSVYYKGEEKYSSDVANKFFTGNINTLINGFRNKERTKDIYIKIGEVAAFSISVA